MVYKAATMANHEPIRFTEGEPMLIQSPPGNRLRPGGAPRL